MYDDSARRDAPHCCVCGRQPVSCCHWGTEEYEQLAMNRYGWMVVRAYLPALAALAAAVVCMLWTSLFGSVSHLHGLVAYAKWLPPVFLLAALVTGLISTLRLWNWKTGKAPRCAGCGGPLSRLHHGAHGDFRKCLACGGKQTQST